MYVKASCDRHLLAAAHDNIDVGGVLAVLKAILALGKHCICIQNSSLGIYIIGYTMQWICKTLFRTCGFSRVFCMHLFPC